jgi:DNA-binding transcriptional LysR family regulator
MVAAVPSGHALAKRKSIDLRELQNEAFILYPRAVRPGLADAVVLACEKAGFKPRVEQYAPQLAATINLVAASLGVSVVPRSMQGLQPSALAYIPLRGRPVRAQLSLAHRTQESAPAVLKFIELTRKAARTGTA